MGTVLARRERASLCCARVARDAPAVGRSTSSLGRNPDAFALILTRLIVTDTPQDYG
jgi:hypothetical protein